VPAMTALSTFTNGSVTTAAAVNNLPTNIDALCQQTTGFPAARGASSKPLVKVIRNATQLAIGNTFALINWTSTIVDNSHMWGASPASQLLVTIPGWYRISAQATWAYGPVNYEFCVQIYLNGTADPANVPASHDMLLGANPDGNPRQQVHAYEHLAAGATIYLGVYQNTGADRDVVPAPYGTWMTAAWDAPY
jgi:hypothetical protein